jgi:hypothetical protein
MFVPAAALLFNHLPVDGCTRFESCLLFIFTATTTPRLADHVKQWVTNRSWPELRDLSIFDENAIVGARALFWFVAILLGWFKRCEASIEL